MQFACAQRAGSHSEDYSGQAWDEQELDEKVTTSVRIDGLTLHVPNPIAYTGFIEVEIYADGKCHLNWFH